MSEVDPRRALKLFLAAAPYEMIAEQLDCSVEDATTAVQAAIAASSVALDQTPARILELERLDALHRAVWAKALRGEVAAVDRVLRIQEARQRMLGEPTRVKDAITDALEATLNELTTQAADGALIASLRQVARQIDHAVANGTSLEATKAMYLLPHMWNGLRELGATPAARAALQASMPAPDPTSAAVPEKGGPVDLTDFKNRHRGGAG
ncbi:terminase small subunit [Microbacterium sp. MMO-56]|uniref:terminase small subunit n=1 Tax=Microbacterium sp. MMO-56 TaxID=3081281 RepID=UPI0030192E41